MRGKRPKLGSGKLGTRMNISIPTYLKNEMIRKPKVNWSQIACEAFLTYLKENSKK